MITLCNSSVERQLSFTKIMCRSIAKRSKLISEVCITVSDEEHEEEWEENNIKFKIRSGDPIISHQNITTTARCMQHAAGLSKAVSDATNEYVVLSDPDLFYYAAVDEIFYNLMKKYNLNIIGVSHPAAVTQGFTFFPNVIHCLLKKTDLDQNFLRNNPYLETHPELLNEKELHPIKEKIINKIRYLSLTPCMVSSYENLYPNKNGHFECGSNLCLYGIMKNWRWLSFQTPDVHLYTTQYYKSNFKLMERIPKEKLLYHQVGSAGVEHGFLAPFAQKFELEG